MTESIDTLCIIYILCETTTKLNIPIYNFNPLDAYLKYYKYFSILMLEAGLDTIYKKIKFTI